MELYGISTFVHIAAAMVLVGAAAASYPVMALIERSRNVAELRPLTQLLGLVFRIAPIAAVVTLLAGLHLAFAGAWWGSGWVVVALVLFVAAGGIAGAYLDPHAKRLIAAVEAVADGPVPAAVRDLVHQPGPHRMERVLTGIDVAILILMTNKPGYAVALLVAAAAIATGVLWSAAARRRVAARTAPATAA